MGKMIRLYTRQNDKTLRQLERDGRIINHRAYVEMHFGDIAPLFMESYDWFTKEAAKMLPKPEDVHAPIWCSISKDNCLKPIPGTVVYVLEVPEDKVIYFDDVKWDYVLNRIYLPDNDEDAAAYKKHLKEIGVSNSFEFFEGRYKGMYPQRFGRAGREHSGLINGRSSMSVAISGKSEKSGCVRLFIRERRFRLIRI